MVLWPDASHAVAAANLRQALSRIRHFQTEHNFFFIESSFSTVFLATHLPVNFDLFDLLGRLSNPSPKAAVELCTIYSGELLADLPESGTEFEEWLALQRDHLRNRCIDRLTGAISATTALSSEERVACAQKLLEIDPCNEDAYRSLMLEAAEHGQTSRVHTLFENCQRQLIRDFGVRPSEQTTHLFKELIERLNA